MLLATMALTACSWNWKVHVQPVVNQQNRLIILCSIPSPVQLCSHRVLSSSNISSILDVNPYLQVVSYQRKNILVYFYGIDIGFLRRTLCKELKLESNAVKS